MTPALKPGSFFAYFLAQGGAAFVEEGVAKLSPAGTYYLNRKVSYTLVEVDNFTAETPLVDPITGAEYAKVFALVSPKIEDVDLDKEFAPRKKADSVEDTGVEE